MAGRGASPQVVLAFSMDTLTLEKEKKQKWMPEAGQGTRRGPCSGFEGQVGHPEKRPGMEEGKTVKDVFYFRLIGAFLWRIPFGQGGFKCIERERTPAATRSIAHSIGATGQSASEGEEEDEEGEEAVENSKDSLGFGRPSARRCATPRLKLAIIPQRRKCWKSLRSGRV